MVPITHILRGESLTFKPNNPLHDHGFVSIVVGLAVGAVVFLIIVGLILFLYRENSPLARCHGRRKYTEQRPKSLEFAPSFNSSSSAIRKPLPTVTEVDRTAHLNDSSFEISVLPLSRLIPLLQSPTHTTSERVVSAISTDSSDSWGDFAPNTRRLVVSGESFRDYSWLLDIIHDHTAELFRHSRISGPYKLAAKASKEEGNGEK